MEQQLKEKELLLQPVYYNSWSCTSQPCKGLEEAAPANYGWRNLSDFPEKVLLPLAPAQSDPHTKSSSSCSCRTASKGDTKHLELKIQCSWLLSEYMESLRSSKDTVK